MRRDTHESNPLSGAFTTLRDLKRSKAISSETESRLRSVLVPDEQDPINYNILSSIGSQRLENLRRVVTSGTGNNLTVEDLSKLDELIRVTRRIEPKIPKPRRESVPLDRRALLKRGAVGLATVGLGALGFYGYTENNRTNSIREIEKRGRETFGSFFFGADAVERAFGIHLPVEKVPEIPFSQAELNRAKELDQFLILRTDKTSKGKPLTVDTMEKLIVGNGGGFIIEKGNSWFTLGDPLLKKDVPRPKWALVSKNFVPGSFGKPFTKQIEIIAEYIRNGVFKNTVPTPAYADALKEFEEQKPMIDSMDKKARDYNMDALMKFTSLKLVQMTTHSPAELFFDIMVRHKSNQGMLLEGGALTHGQTFGYELVAFFSRRLGVRNQYWALTVGSRKFDESRASSNNVGIYASRT